MLPATRAYALRVCGIVAAVLVVGGGFVWWTLYKPLVLATFEGIGEDMRAAVVCVPDAKGIDTIQLRLFWNELEQARLTLFPTVDMRTECFAPYYRVRGLRLSENKHWVYLDLEKGTVALPVVFQVPEHVHYLEHTTGEDEERPSPRLW